MVFLRNTEAQANWKIAAIILENNVLCYLDVASVERSKQSQPDFLTFRLICKAQSNKGMIFINKLSVSSCQKNECVTHRGKLPQQN